MAIRIENLSYTYGVGTPFETKALEKVSLEIRKGEALGILGPTGSGKSTLMKALNGLVLPTEGTVHVDEVSTREKKSLKEIRRKVGLVFQYPENQLFGDTVLEDVMFAPLNLGYRRDEAEKKAKEALSLVGLDEGYWKRSPLRLSGGEKRKVAVAGILSMDPEYLVLDEPAAGLDGSSRDSLYTLLSSLKKEGKGIVVVSHSIEDAAEHMDRLLVLEDGRMKAYGTKEEVFALPGMEKPEAMAASEVLRKKGIHTVGVVTMESLAEALASALR